MNTTLKPCPFCGGVPRVITIDATEDHPDAGGGYIECVECRASTHIMFPIHEDVYGKLVERWNTGRIDIIKYKFGKS